MNKPQLLNECHVNVTIHFCSLQEQSALYMRKIETEKRKVEELDRQIAKYQAKIIDQKSRLGMMNQMLF
jgi:hypothetical protein